MDVTLFAIAFFVMLFLNIPIAMSMCLSSVFYLFITGDIFMISITAPRFFAGMNSFTMLAIPLFILSGDLLCSGKASKLLIDMANSMVGHFRGGLSSVTTLACMFFGAVSGSGAATASAIGSVVAPESERSGYNKSFIAAIIASAGPLGILIPPSIPMVVYGAATDTSIGALLLSGIGPGILFGLMIMGYGYWISSKYNYGGVSSFELKNVFISSRKAFWALLTPVIIVGGIYSGIFTPTEAAAVAAVYSMAVGLFIYRTLKFRDLPSIFLKSAVSSASIMFVVGGVVLFGWILVREQIPQNLTRMILENVSSPITFLLIADAVILVAGMLMDPSPAIILFAPLLLPAAQAFNIDPVYFGALMVTNLAIGLVTPPVALTLYVAARICDVSMSRLIKHVLPIIAMLILGLLILTFVPQIAMFIPNLLM
ncbi:MAG TPA: TRAP transporter large permease [Synergistales bacterium]|nr:TRAP transporter large permease [Synergistales bacterium]